MRNTVKTIDLSQSVGFFAIDEEKIICLASQIGSELFQYQNSSSSVSVMVPTNSFKIKQFE